MATETDSSHLPQSSSSSSLPPQQPNNPVDHLSSSDSSTQGLQNEGMNNNGFQIRSSDDFYSCIVFCINQLKNILLSCFKPDSIAREANEELSKPQATTESSHVYQSIPCGEQIQKDDISRKPFDPIGRPFNPFGPIERPIPRLPSSSDLADLGFV